MLTYLFRSQRAAWTLVLSRAILKAWEAVAGIKEWHDDSQGAVFNRQLPRMGIAMLDRTVH